MKVTLVRHAESEFNRTGIDRINCTITHIGVKQASKLTGFYDIVICSPLKRCLQTLEFSDILYDKLIVSNLCREYRINACDFLEHESVIAETERDLLKRVEEFKKFLKDTIMPNESVLIITHADFIFYLTSKLIDGEYYGQWMDNCQMIELEIN